MFQNTVPLGLSTARWRIYLPFLGILLLSSPIFAQPGSDRGLGLGSGVGTGGGVGGYIESAIVTNQIRFRYDTAWGNNKPDRAEFFYAKCGCFRVLGADPNAPGPAPNTPPRVLETNVDFQVFQADIEYMLTPNISALFEVPVRLLNPEVNDNTGGISDLQAAVKCSLYHDERQAYTFQFRTYIPTGKAERGLGTNHVSLEPGLLIYKELSDRLTIEGELKDWISIGGSSADGTGFADESRFAGNVLRYGLGLGVDVYETDERRLTPIFECVGWTLLDGLSSSSTDGTLATALIEKVDGDTIINLKGGVRLSDRSLGSIYAGYGTAVTDEVWYTDILRIEYRHGF